MIWPQSPRSAMAVWCVRCCLGLFALLAVLLVLIVALPYRWVGAGGASLLGEERIDSAETARHFADEMVDEALRLWDQRDGWFVALEGAMVVESRRIDFGPFARSGVLLTRGTARLANVSADSLFTLMTSVEGFAIIDPFSNPADFAISNERFSGWRNARLDVAPARAELGPLASPREFCVLNAIDPETRIFVSKSVQHRSMPGSSIYGDGGETSSGAVRTLNTFALRTRVDGDDVLMDVINYADMVGSTTLINWINVKVFLPGILDRLQQRLHNKRSSAAEL